MPTSPFVAITGTNGKSTTTALVAHLMREAGYDVQMGGNIGTAILSLEPPRMGRVHVIEMSSYQIDLTPSLDPSVGILLNVTEDHIDRHGTLAHYAEVKERLVVAVQRGGTAIVGVDDNWSAAIADHVEQAGKHIVRVSVKRPLADGVYLDQDSIVRASGGSRTELVKIDNIGSLRGLHNAQNAACSACAALALGVSGDVLQKGLRSFPGLPIAWNRSAARVRCCSSTTPKAPTPTRRKKHCRRSTTSSGLPVASRRRGYRDPCAGLFPRIRKAYLIGEAAEDFAKHAWQRSA